MIYFSVYSIEKLLCDFMISGCKVAMIQLLIIAALNIQRGRDHGIASYDDVRQLCNLEQLPETWDDDKRPSELPEEQWELFKGLYTSPKDIELFPAGMSETSETDGIVGPTFACIIGQQFKKLKYSDRYQQDQR